MVQLSLKNILLISVFSVCMMPAVSNASNTANVLEVEKQAGKNTIPSQAVPVDETEPPVTKKVVWTQHMWNCFHRRHTSDPRNEQNYAPSLHPNNPHIWVDTDGLLPAKSTSQPRYPNLN